MADPNGTPQGPASDPANAKTLEAVRAGDYSGAHAAWQRVTDVDPRIHGSVSAFLLALCERFNEAEHLATTGELAGIAVIVRGERARLARWTELAGSRALATAAPIDEAEHYAGLAHAFATSDAALADRSKKALDGARRPVGGRLTLRSGDVIAFRELVDADDAIGGMLEAYAGSGLLYFPFSAVQRVELLPPDNFMDHLMPLARVTSTAGSGVVYVPLLYALSARNPEEAVRNGTLTTFSYLGKARRGLGHRDLVVDGNRLIGLAKIAAIDFEPAG